MVQIWPGKTVTCLHTNSPGHIWTTLYISTQYTEVEKAVIISYWPSVYCRDLYFFTCCRVRCPAWSWMFLKKTKFKTLLFWAGFGIWASASLKDWVRFMELFQGRHNKIKNYYTLITITAWQLHVNRWWCVHRPVKEHIVFNVKANDIYVPSSKRCASTMYFLVRVNIKYPKSEGSTGVISASSQHAAPVLQLT